MIKLTKRDKRTGLEKEVDRVLCEMVNENPSAPRYATMAENLNTLCEAKSKEKARRISPDTLAVVAGNLLGIGIIISYEHFHPIASKALGFVLRGRV